MTESNPTGQVTLITGGAGFVGTNLADGILRNGGRVAVLDNLSRPGVEANLRWLRDRYRDRLRVEIGDIRDAAAIRRALEGVGRVFHFAAQVAVTSSVADPIHDFGVNLQGTVTLLEELRRMAQPPPLLFTSTNKVYGNLHGLGLEKRGHRYRPVDPTVERVGVDESRVLQFCSPYGCSKGGADQYVLDYFASYGLPTVVFRMSCIYGPHQCGNEDQGWVAHFLMRALDGQAITIYGDGCQVRDILFVDDLVAAMLLALDRVGDLAGRAFNIGGGPDQSISLLELIDMIGHQQNHLPEVRFDSWRVGDQLYYVSDTTAFRAATGWAPAVRPAEGVARLHRWLVDRRYPERRLRRALSEAI